MRKFKMFALAIWIYTLLWTIAVWFATLFECHPISFYWNKHQQGGSCVKNPLITIGLTSGVLSCIGDIIIFSLPFPVLSKLKLNSRKKMGLMGIFTLGLLYVPPRIPCCITNRHSVVCISFIRWVALLGTEGNITCR